MTAEQLAKIVARAFDGDKEIVQVGVIGNEPNVVGVEFDDGSAFFVTVEPA